MQKKKKQQAWLNHAALTQGERETVDAEDAAAWMNELQRSSPVIWEVWSLLVQAEASRGGSHLTQLSCGTQMGPEKLPAVCGTSYKREMWSSSD